MLVYRWIPNRNLFIALGIIPIIFEAETWSRYVCKRVIILAGSCVLVLELFVNLQNSNLKQQSYTDVNPVLNHWKRNGYGPDDLTKKVVEFRLVRFKPIDHLRQWKTDLSHVYTYLNR